MNSEPEPFNREEAIGALIVIGLVSFAFGYRTGKTTGRRDVLTGLDSALRIIHRNKE